MKNSWRIVLMAVAIILSMGARPARCEKMVPLSNRIPLVVDQKQTGSWSAPDLELNYAYSADSGKMAIAVNLRFAEKIITNFIHVRRFHVKIYWTDESGRVISTMGLYSTSDVEADQVMKFRTEIAVPEGAHAFAFGYTGMARGSGVKPVETTFWEDPTRRT